MASGADLKVAFKYEISYTTGLEPKNAVNWRLLGLDLNKGDDNQTFHWDVPGNGGPDSSILLEHDYDWGPVAGTCVFSSGEDLYPPSSPCYMLTSSFFVVVFPITGHVHIGAINTTLYDISDAKKAPQSISFAKAVYSDAGFITAMDRKDSIHTFPKDGKLRISSYYDNTKNYAKVMSLTSTYASVNLPPAGDPESDTRRRQWEQQQSKELTAVLELFNSTLRFYSPLVSSRK